MEPRRELPAASAQLLFHPEQDVGYISFRGSEGHPFEANARQFSAVNGWWLAEAALLGYWNASPSDPGGAQQRFARAGLTSYRFVTSPRGGIAWTDTQCHVAGNSEFVIISFRGTQADKFVDVVNDATFVTTPFPERAGRVHAGFLLALDAIWDELSAALGAMVPNAAGRSAPTIWLTGHSLGAAVATLAAARLGDKVRGVYTFGCPRVGDATFRKSFDAALEDRCWRYVNDHDIVPQVPPEGVLGYDHVGRLVYFDDRGNLASPPASIAGFLEGVFGDLRHVCASVSALLQGHISLLPAYLLDHTPSRYAVLAWNAA
jgi:triacylglycerol lipase